MPGAALSPLARRRALLAALTLPAWLTAGCASVRAARAGVEERLHACLVDDEFAVLALLGERTHYVFESAASLRAAMNTGFAARLRGQPDQIALFGGDTVTAAFRLVLLDDATPAERRAARDAGFQETFGRVESRALLAGRRYAAPGSAAARSPSPESALAVPFVERTPGAARRDPGAVSPVVLQAGRGWMLGDKALSPLVTRLPRLPA